MHWYRTIVCISSYCLVPANSLLSFLFSAFNWLYFSVYAAIIMNNTQHLCVTVCMSVVVMLCTSFSFNSSRDFWLCRLISCSVDVCTCSCIYMCICYTHNTCTYTCTNTHTHTHTHHTHMHTHMRARMHTQLYLYKLWLTLLIIISSLKVVHSFHKSSYCWRTVETSVVLATQYIYRMVITWADHMIKCTSKLLLQLIQ